MAGNEAGLGDPIEDSVSIATVAGLSHSSIVFKALICIGVGTDRFMDVSDASTFRAIAEINRRDGFLGCVGLEKNSQGYEFYKKALERIYELQSFRSVLSGSILAACQGFYGSDVIPEVMGNRVKEGELFVWPVMAML